MFTPPLRMFMSIKFSLFTSYGRFSNKITCVQNNLTFVIKCFGYASRFLCVLRLNSNFFSQCFLYYNSIFHFVLPLLCAPVLRHGWTVLYNHAAKLQQISELCKFINRLKEKKRIIAANMRQKCKMKRS